MAEYIKVSEAAEILGKHRWTVWNWVRLKKIKPAMVVGGENLFLRTDIERIAEQQKIAA